MQIKRKSGIPNHHFVSLETLKEQISRIGFKALIRIMQSKLKISDLPRYFKGKMMLDIGCGLGADVLRFRRLGATCFGFDKIINCYDKDLFGGDINQGLPFASANFDIVYSKNLLDLLSSSEAKKYFSEAYRVLKPGGILIVLGTLALTNDEFWEIENFVRDLGFQTVGLQQHSSHMLLSKT